MKPRNGGKRNAGNDLKHAEIAEPCETCRTLILRRIAIPKILRFLREIESQREMILEIDAEPKVGRMVSLGMSFIKCRQNVVLGKEA